MKPLPWLGAGLFALLAAGPAAAADHMEAPGTKADLAADLADVYAWHDVARNSLVTVVTFDGIKTPIPRQRGTFQEGVRYTVHLDNNGDYVSDIDINVRFHRRFKHDDDSAGDRFLMTVENLPGARCSLTGKVEHVLRRGPNVKAFAGLRDDPFFFDLEGFRTTLQTGTLSFNSSRDTFAGKNATAIVLEMDLAAALGSGSALNLWADTTREQ